MRKWSCRETNRNFKKISATKILTQRQQENWRSSLILVGTFFSQMH